MCEQRDLAHVGAAVPFPGVAQIKRRLWGFSPAPMGPSSKGFWTALRLGLSSQLTSHFSAGAPSVCAHPGRAAGRRLQSRRELGNVLHWGNEEGPAAGLSRLGQRKKAGPTEPGT